ncbi:hypothetical protein [Gloeobacter kilaueensis]|uniref:Uncharacterized protein n=1 Tax=Gloeobacter kilaueensis (strain ATCC BAA-2537 / CCAP 1431/1 / ULC 316 / JS1) TaxID=1183438 RepID=U5QPP6_GLOK1|nr:hypothetical protein [Gloeobacter kilaueensis]AGY59670.1 hypothetical protein GKIL_3424 [Gloeobacter kilaueensis JS1]
MTSQHLRRRHTLQILGCSIGISIPLLACATLIHVALTGQMPLLATGSLPLVLLFVSGLLAGWIWIETAELG